ncbi:MAG TPA: hypothetical protein ACFYEA_02535 [Candidatus Tripitaka californicus]|uniref:hypothetical protein n=1 Tax=Candidatus Tripitaka californicus TaxID=3367616 RepID=UPI0040273964
MEQKIGNRGQGNCRGLLHKPQTKPELKELDRLKLERLNLSISNINLQLALLNERARALQIETAGLQAEREGLVRGITEGCGLDGKWRLNPDTLEFVGVETAPALKGEDK